MLRWFEKEPGAEWKTAEEGLIDIPKALDSLDLVEPCPDVEDFCLNPDFRSWWHDRMTAVDGDGDRVAAIGSMLDVDPSATSMNQYGSAAVVVRYENRQVGQWESDAALVADVAADQVLSEWDDTWTELDPVNRSRILNSLRMFLERCPSCGGPASLGQETVESCCREMEVAAVSCSECGERLFEVELEESFDGG